MANIEAFRGIRYDLGHVGALSDVVAPPYDVIDETLQDTLYEQHPANVIRLILNREEPGDDDPDQRYKRAAKYLKRWQQEGSSAQKQIRPSTSIIKCLKKPVSPIPAVASCPVSDWNRSEKERSTRTNKPTLPPRQIDLN